MCVFAGYFCIGLGIIELFYSVRFDLLQVMLISRILAR